MLKEIIRCLHEPDYCLPSRGVDYDKLIEEIEHFGVSSQFYHFLKLQGRLEDTPLFFQVRLKENYNEAMYINLYIKNQKRELLLLFERMKVEVIPLKGVYFSEKYFGHFGARGTSDIDILVRREELATAVECVKELGFSQEEEGIPLHFHIRFNKKIMGSSLPLTVEIHWNLVREETSSFNIEECWMNAIKFNDYRYIKQLSDYHTFYMICLHGWRHNLDSPKYYIDILLLTYQLKDSINIDALLNDAKDHKTYRRLIRTLSIVYQEFPHLNEVMTFPQQQAKKKYPTIFSRSTTTSMDLYLDFVNYQFFSYDSFDHSLKEIRTWIFPSQKDITKELNINIKNRFYVFDFMCLYKHRISSILRTLFVRI